MITLTAKQFADAWDKLPRPERYGWQKALSHPTFHCAVLTDDITVLGGWGDNAETIVVKAEILTFRISDTHQGLVWRLLTPVVIEN